MAWALRIAALVLLVLLPAIPGRAEEPPGLRFGGLSTASFIEGYYLSPRPLEALERLATLDLAAITAGREEPDAMQAYAVLGAFYAHVLRAHPALTPVLVERLLAGVPPDNALVAAIACRTAGTAAGEAALGRLGAAGVLDATVLALVRQLAPFPFPAMTAESHYDIDLFWVSFFATGDVAYIDKIAAPMTYRPPPTSPADEPTDAAEATRLRQLDLIRVATAVAAHDTLLLYGPRHPLVVAELRRLAIRNDELGGIAAGLVATIEAAGP